MFVLCNASLVFIGFGYNIYLYLCMVRLPIVGVLPKKCSSNYLEKLELLSGFVDSLHWIK